MADPYVRSEYVAPDVARYAAHHTSPPDELQAGLRAVTRQRFADAAVMQIGDDQALLLEMLSRAIGARRAVEVGTFTGYSALAIARGMGPEGRLVCCDISETWTAVARDAWERAGVGDRIELRIGPAIESLRAMPDDPVLDLAFLDADKASYPDYYAEIVPRLRQGGLLLVDNTIFGRRVLDAEPGDADVDGIRELNDRVLTDPAVAAVLLPIGDGVTVVQKVT